MKGFYQWWIIALVVKTALATWLPFSNDEAYYWFWGHHPQWSYFDHPPMVGWLFWLGTFLESFGNAARLPGVWLGHATLLVWNSILSPYLSDDRRTVWLWFVVLSPLIGVGSLVVTPDVPLLFFWSLSLLVFLRAIAKPTLVTYAFLGASLGLGFCSKYLIVLFVPAAFAWLIWSKQLLRVRWAFVPLTVIIGLLFCFPVLYWNSQHDWISFKFQLDHGLESEKWDPVWPLEYIGGQLLILFPAVVWLATRKREPKDAVFLHFFGWLPIGFFLLTSFKAHVEANWPIMGYHSILALAVLNAPSLRSLYPTMIIWGTAIVIAITEIAHHWLPIDPRRLKTSEFTRFDAFVPEAEARKNLYFGSYQMAAAVSYKLRRPFFKLGGMNRKDFFDFLPQSFPKSASLAVGRENEQEYPAWISQQGFKQVQSKQLTSDFQIVEVERNAQGSNH